MAGAVDREHLRELVKASGRSARAISLDAGLGATAVKDILSGKSRDPGAATMQAIAGQLGVTTEELMSGDAPSPPKGRVPSLASLKTVMLPIVHKVAAGAWLASDDVRDDVLGHAEAHWLPEYASIQQWLEVVEGDSVDKLLAPGALIHVVDAIGLGYAPKDGDLVVAVRRRAQGAFTERSVKQVAVTPEGVELWPRSHNPRWNTPLSLTDGMREGEHAEVEIVGKVVRAYIQFGS